MEAKESSFGFSIRLSHLGFESGIYRNLRSSGERRIFEGKGRDNRREM
jgi:hypothetical protein